MKPIHPKPKSEDSNTQPKKENTNLARRILTKFSFTQFPNSSNMDEHNM